MDPETPEKLSGAWTEEAKFQFLLRIVAQLKEDGRTIKWEKINLPGRTTKSLKNMWTKINKQIADFEAQEKSGEPTPVKTPGKRGPPKKKSLMKMTDLEDDALDDEEVGIKRALLKKRAAEDFGDEVSVVGIKRTKVKAETNDAVRCKKEDD
ncbi:hypothetical protein ACHAQJ_002111 [Trichoderma viride]